MIQIRSKNMGYPGSCSNAHVDEMAANAGQDPYTSTNPRETSVEEMKKLYIAAFYGLNVNF